MNAPTLSAATAAVSAMEDVVDAALARLATVDIDEHQVVAYDIAHGAAAVASARNLLGYGVHGEAEERLTVAFVADVAHDLATRLLGRETDWGVNRGALDGIHDFMAAGRAPELLASLVDGAPSHLDEDMQLASETFRRFADEQIAREPNTCTAPTPTYPRSSSRDSPNSGSSVSPRRSSTAASPRVASTTTSAWSSPPRNSPAARSASAVR